jgi:hypothetical protein
MRNETLRDLNTISDYNMVDSQDTANPFREGTTNYNLAGWQANDTNFASSTHDNNTKVENGINWVGTNPTSDDMASFALDAASAGHNAASDATDIGADVSLVGPEALGY